MVFYVTELMFYSATKLIPLDFTVCMYSLPYYKKINSNMIYIYMHNDRQMIYNVNFILLGCCSMLQAFTLLQNLALVPDQNSC